MANVDVSTTFQEYLKEAPPINKIHYWNLPNHLQIGIRDPNRRSRKITIRKLKLEYGFNPKINRRIRYVYNWKGRRYKFPIELPLSLTNENYVKIYALMSSEGSYKTEFRLQVPEKIFHEKLVKALQSLFGRGIKNHIFQDETNNVLRTNIPRIVRYFLPIPQHVPKFILKNREFCRKYLKIAFEAEGSPIFVRSKRYISLKRNTDVTKILKGKISYPIGKRIYLGELGKDHPHLTKKVKQYPPLTLLGEHLILKHHFDIHSTIKFEAIRVNKTSYRCGEISARWALYIYADSVNRFIKEINFLSKRKRKITYEMSKINGRRRQYFALEVMKKIATNDILSTSDFTKEMKSYGYVSSCTYLSRYTKQGILKRIKHGKYKLLVN